MNLTNLKKVGLVKSYDKKTYIFKEGDPGENMYFVLAGTVEIYISSHDGSPIKVSEIVAGGFFGEMSLLEDEPRSASALANKDTITLSVDKSSFHAFICQEPATAIKLMKVLSSRIRILNEEVAKLKGICGIILNEGHQTAPLEEDEEQIPKANEFLELLYPTRHKSYKSTASIADNEYLFDKKLKCPVCVTEFSAKAILSSKLRSQGIDRDLRQRYKDFDILWYNLHVCPNCLFTGYINEYEATLNVKIRDFIEKTKEIKSKVKYIYSEPRKIDEVFTAYYLALYSNKHAGYNPLKKARLWLQLHWLYRDVNDLEMSTMSAQTALESYHEVIYKSTCSLSAEQEQQCHIIMGELSLVGGQREDAIKCFHSAISTKGGSERFKVIARDAIYTIKSDRANK